MPAIAPHRLKEPGSAANRFGTEFELLVACCGLADKTHFTQSLTQPLDWEKVLTSAEHHRLLPALYDALSSTKSRVLPSILRNRARIHIWRSLNLISELKRIAQEFDKCEITFLAYKGPALSQLLYREPMKRQFGDLDFLVKPADVERARRVLQELGYEPKLNLSPQQAEAFLHSGYEHEFNFNSRSQRIEIQWRIVPRFYSIDFCMQAMFDRSVEIELDGYKLRTLCGEDLMLALCVHGAKHGWSQLGMLRDVMTLAQFDLDWKGILREARRLGIVKLLQISFLAGEKLFGTKLPQELPLAAGLETRCARQIVLNLANDREPETKSVAYFRAQLQYREKWRDRARFVWRLATTPSVSEWNATRVPRRWFGLYRGLRMARVLKRILTSRRPATIATRIC